MANTLVLLRLDAPGTADNPIHIVVKGMVFYPDGGQPVLDDKSDERDSYYYDVHTCPWNYLRLPIKEGDNTDPHGLFVHQETILMPKGYEGRIEVKDKDGDYDSIDAWRKLFTSLR